MSPTEVTIARLGQEGDGVAETPEGRLRIPFAAPGDRVEIRPTGKGRAEIVSLQQAGPARVSPPCGHFGRCGGCALQHVDPDMVASWKRERVMTALAAAGLPEIPVAETIRISPGTRRRATLAARRTAAGVVLGFAERASHRLVDIAECPVLTPELTGFASHVRPLLAPILRSGETADLALTATETGLDLTLIRERPLSLSDRETLAALAEAEDLARISWRAAANRPAEPIAARRTPVVRFGSLALPLPVGAFLQPSLEGEAALAGLVADAAAGTEGPIADLFCGLGTFAARLSAARSVTGFDADPESIAVLSGTARGAGSGDRLQATRRDLFRDPLTPSELAPFGLVVIDPPRAGAQAQCAALAKSAVPTIAMPSCNPGSFARDAAILAAGGYRLERVTPIDQFAWSPHVELMAIFRRS